MLHSSWKINQYNLCDSGRPLTSRIIGLIWWTHTSCRPHTWFMETPECSGPHDFGCVYLFALNVTGPASKSQIPQRGEEVFHFLLKEAIAVFCVLTSPFRVPQFDLKHSFSFSLLFHLLLKSLHLRTHRWTRLLQPAEGRTPRCERTIQRSQRAVTYERHFRRREKKTM